MKTPALVLAVLLPCLAAFPAHSELPSASGLGKQRAAASKLEWELKDAGHPALGNIRFAFLKTPIETPVGNSKVFSRVYFSCERAAKRFAIELTNGTSPDDAGGMKPANDPRIYCNRPLQPWDEKLVQEEILVHWDVSKIGDALTRGIRPFPLRECVSIRVLQEVTLPAGWSQKTAKLEFELHPYSRDLDAVFATCGEQSAYAPAEPPPAVAAAKPLPTPVAPPKLAAMQPPPSQPPPSQPPPAQPPPAPMAPAKPAPPAGLSWQMARVTSSSKTNVRAAPNLTSAVVIMLDPGAVVLVQKTASEWWRAKSTSGSGFEGYIRQDRLVFK
jgi:hypothetical protein